MRLSILMFFIALSAAAQQPQPGDDPIGRSLFPPELMMQHSQQIALSDKQIASIKSESARS